MARKKKFPTGLAVAGGLGIAGLLGLGVVLFSGDAKPPQEPKPPDPEPEPEPAPEPEPEPAPEPAPEPEPAPDILVLPGNWGVTPKDLIPHFMKAEKAAGIPGLGRFMAIWAWGAFRANQAPVGVDEARELAKNSPELCRMCHNTSESERKFSKLALDRVTKPPPEGKYDPPWEAPEDYAGWSDGSYGLFDLLAGTVAHMGIHEGGFTPLISHPATILYEIPVQLYAAGVMTKRIINNPNLLVLVDDNPLETWANVRACTSSPSGFQDLQKGKATNGAKVAAKARDNFFMRAIEIGIDPAGMQMPFDKKTDLHWLWPGAEAYFDALGVKL